MFRKSILAPVILLLAVYVSACGDHQSPAAPSPPAPTPSQVLSQWSVTAHLNTVSLNDTLGDKCAAEAVRSLLGTSKPYSIRVTQTGSNVDVTLASSSGDYDCTFTKAKADGGGFTTWGTNGVYNCRTDFVTHNFACSDGTQANLLTFGQDLSGGISDDEISGTWEIFWLDRSRGDVGLQTWSEFAGRRQ